MIKDQSGGEIEVRLSGEFAGAATVLRLDPNGASQLAAVLTHAADHTAHAAPAGSARIASQKGTFP